MGLCRQGDAVPLDPLPRAEGPWIPPGLGKGMPMTAHLWKTRAGHPLPQTEFSEAQGLGPWWGVQGGKAPWRHGS